jgi:hypothetical protein
VRVAARALESRLPEPTVVRRRVSVQAVAGGGLLVAFLVVLAASVIWVSQDSKGSKHPLVLPNPSPPTTSAPSPSPTVVAGPIPLPATPTQQPPPAETPTAPVNAMPPTQVTAETLAPAPPPWPRRLRLHQLFPQLFPDG